MRITGNVVLASALCACVVLMSACDGPAPGPQAAATAAPADKPLALIEIVARPAGEQPGAFARPAHPVDVIELAIRTEGSTKAAELSAKMIALSDGSAVGTQQLRLNAGNAATPTLKFEPNGAWVTGRYLFEVSLDGKLAGSQELEIFPPDPAAPAL
jgi:hypothetical protein